MTAAYQEPQADGCPRPPARRPTLPAVPTELLPTSLPLAAGEAGAAYGIVLTGVLVLGVAAQWIAWRLKVPSILLLLLFGFVAGPVLKSATDGAFFLDVEAVFDSGALLALVSLAVGLILFEGGLSLNFGEIRGVRNAVLCLVTIGALVTWVIASLAAWLILDLPGGVAALLGAILVVTGPTVIGPLLRFVRPTGSVGKVLKWEGIVIDPIGALLAVLVFEAVAAGHAVTEAGTFWSFAQGAVLASVVGTTAGLLGATLVAWMMSRFLVPDHLQVPLSLGVAALAFTASNLAAPEAGLFATTVMGLALANQKRVRVTHILEFKETLVILLIALLFIALSARLSLADLQQIDPLRAAGFLLVLILIARPLAVFASTAGPLAGGVKFKDKLFLSWMAPRGIVAAAIASVFGLALRQRGVEGAELLTPYTFLTIVTTVAIYGLSSVWVARRLGIANPSNSGVLIAGASPLARSVGKALQDEGVEVLLVDLNYGNIQQARLAGLPTMVANVLSPQVHERIELSSIGRLLALTPNNEVNSLAAVQYGRHFGRSSVFQLSPESRKKQEASKKKGEAGEKREDVDAEVRGRFAFAGGPTFDLLEDLVNAGAKVKRTKLSREFTFDRWREEHGADDGHAVPLFLVEDDDDGAVRVLTPDAKLDPKPGQSIIALSMAGASVSARPTRAEVEDYRESEVGEVSDPAGETVYEAIAAVR